MRFVYYQILNFIRISGILFLFYAYVIPFAFPFLKERKLIDRAILSFIFFNGLFLFFGPLFVEARFIDIPGLLVFILFIYFFPTLWKNKGNLLPLIQKVERQTVLEIVRSLEKLRRQEKRPWDFSAIYQKFKFLAIHTLRNKYFWIFVLNAGIYYGISMTHPAPYSKEWFDYLIGLKNIQSARIWEPFLPDRNFLLLTYFWSILTHTEPEIILQFSGSIFWGYSMLALAFFWKKFVNGNTIVLFFTTLTFSVCPSVISLIFPERHIYLNADLIIFLYFILFYYLLSELPVFSFSVKIALISLLYISFGMINFFYFGFFIVPITLGMIVVNKNFRKVLSISLLISSTAVFLHFLVYQLFTGQSWIQYVRKYLFNPEKFSLFENFIIPMEKFPVYVMALLILVGGLTILIFRSSEKRMKFMIFWVISGIIFLIPFFPESKLAYRWVDIDQLIFIFNIYLIFSSLIIMESLTRSIRFFHLKEKYLQIGSVLLLLMISGPFVYKQVHAGFQPVVDLKLSNHFYKQYYSLIQERLPFSYAVVAPPINHILARNRHYYMNYNYFLKEYGKIDSLYHDVLLVYGDKKLKTRRIPPPSIFVFVVKPPYHFKRSSYFYPDASTMQRIIQWMEQYQQLKRRKVNIYYKDARYIIYEIVNIPKKSSLWELLWEIK